MVSASAAAWKPSLPLSTRNDSRDVEAEVAALNLARRRGKNAPSVDTKLTDAWLGFYVALTKSSARPCPTQASTEAATEASLSEVASSDGLSPLLRRTTSVSTARESWADMEDASEEQLPKKRTRRSRRRRTRGRGKKNRSAAGEAGVEEEEEEDDDELDLQECAPVDEVNVVCASPSASPTTPFRSAITHSVVTSACLLSPTSHAGPILPKEASPLLLPGVIVSTSPSAAHNPVLDASARTPVARLGTPFGASPIAQMMPATPTTFGSLTYQGGHAEYKGTHESPSFMMATLPGNLWMGSPLQSHSIPPPPPTQAPVFFGASCATSAAACSPVSFGTFTDPMRSWLAGGTPTTDAELAMRLLAAAPETYED